MSKQISINIDSHKSWLDGDFFYLDVLHDNTTSSFRWNDNGKTQEEANISIKVNDTWVSLLEFSVDYELSEDRSSVNIYKIHYDL